MNKKLLAIAVAAFVAAPAIATAQTTLFGQVKYEVGYVEQANPDGTSDNNLVHSSKGTRLGVYGSEDLGGGMSAIYRFQGGMTSVQSPMSGNAFQTNEENWVGLRGGFGTLQLGRSDTAMKKTASAFRAFTDTLAEPSLIPSNFGRADGVHYTSPSFAGANGYVTVEPNGTETDVYYALGASYKTGPFYVSAAFESFADTGWYSAPNQATSDAAEDTTNWQIGGKWSFGQGDVGLLYQLIQGRPGGAAAGDARKFDTDVILVPVNFKVTPAVNLRFAAKYVDPDVGGDATSYGIGAQYMFSKRTEAFVNVWIDDLTVRSTDGGTLISTDATNLGLGLRHSF